MELELGDITLRDFKEQDRPALVESLGDGELMRWALTERPMPPEEANAFLDAGFRGIASLSESVLSLRSTDEVVGFTGFRRCTYLGADDVEFGWLIRREHQGRGYATEAGFALIAYAFDVLHLPRILAACNPANAASEHVLRDKLRMRFEAEVEPRPGFRRRVYSAEPGSFERR